MRPRVLRARRRDGPGDGANPPGRAGEPGRRPEPLLPDSTGRACTGSCRPCSVRSTPCRQPAWPGFPGRWPGPLRSVLLVLNGLGEEQLGSAAWPGSCRAASERRSPRWPRPDGVRAHDARHGKGAGGARRGRYRITLDRNIMNVLQSSVQGVDIPHFSMPASAAFPAGRVDPGTHARVPVVTRQDYGPTRVTAAHLGDVDLHRWHTPAQARGLDSAQLARQIRSSTPTTRASTRSLTPRG